MAQQACVFDGSLSIEPPVGDPSGQPTTLMSYTERVYLDRSITANYTLGTDNVVAVAISPLARVNVLSIRVVGGYVLARITTNAGTTQTVPVDPLLILETDNVNITALDLQRQAGIDTEVYIALGEKA